MNSSAAGGLRAESVLAFALMVAGLVWLILRNEVLARSSAAMVVQAAAVLLMIAAPISFGGGKFSGGGQPDSRGAGDQRTLSFLAPSDLCRRLVLRLEYGSRSSFCLRDYCGSARHGRRRGTDVC